MTCRECIELLTEYLDGALSAAEHAALEAHVAGCGECQAYVESFRLTVTVLGDPPAEPADPDVRAHLLAAFRASRRA